LSSPLTKSIYPTFEKRFTEKSLKRFFEPEEHEKAIISTHTKSQDKAVHIYFSTLLKSAQYLHYVPKPTEIPLYIYRFVARSMFPNVLVKRPDIELYSRSGTSKRHARFLRNYFGYYHRDEATRNKAMTIAKEAAKTMARKTDILNAVIDGLIRGGHELPPLTTLEKIARGARAESNEILYHSIVSQLSESQRQSLDSILTPPESANEASLWESFKATPGLPTSNALSSYLLRFDLINNLASNQPNFNEIPSEKRQQLFSEANALHISDMRDIRPVKRYALAAILVSRRWSESLDSLAIVMIKTMQSIENRARKMYLEAYVHDQRHTDVLVTTLRNLIYDLEHAHKNGDQDHFIEHFLEEKGRSLLEACDGHLAKSQDNYKPFMLKGFTSKRKMVFSILQRMPLGSDRHGKSLVSFGYRLFELYAANKENQICCDELHSDLAWLPPSWRPFVFTKTDAGDDQQSIHRGYLELAWFYQIKQQLKSYHCFLEGGAKFGNPEDFLISWEKFEELLPTLLETTDLPPHTKTFVSQLKSDLKTTASTVDADFEHIEGVHFENDELVIHKATTPYKSKTIEPLKAAIAQKMPNVSIIDVISDTVRWLNLHDHFKPLSGLESKIDDPILRCILTLFCFGCNVGAEQTASSVRGVTAKQIRWLSFRHMDEANLNKAIRTVIRKYKKMTLPKRWGSGKHASTDGTLRKTFDANILAEFHARYRQRGAIGYYVVSDTYIALFSRFISCGTQEAWYILDDVVRNELDIQPEIMHGDTHSQSYAVFGLAYLLGIDIMPRVRGVKHLTFHKPTPKSKFKNLKPLFKDHVRWDSIAKAYPDMMRYVLSINQGLLIPSVLLRRLNSSDDILARGFQELGKAIRTVFFLRFISDMDLRKTIQRETNKSEQYNDFSKWLFFANGGVITSNDPFAQEKTVQIHHLVNDLVILFNTHHMTKALNELRAEGYEVNKEDLAHISPYAHYNINLIGGYHVDLKRKLGPLITDLDQ